MEFSCGQLQQAAGAAGKNLLTGDFADCQEFRQNLRPYNCSIVGYFYLPSVLQQVW